MDRKRRLLFGNNVGRGAVASTPSFSATLLSTLVPQVYTGSSTPTFVRATTAYVADWEGLLKQVPSGAARFTGARLVWNGVQSKNYVTGIAGNSNTTVTSGVSDPLGGTNAYTLTAAAASALIWYNISAFPLGNLVRTSVWMRRRTGTGAVRLRSATTQTDISGSLTSSWQRICNPAEDNTAATTSYHFISIATSGDAIDVFQPQTEIVTGQSVQTPGEYVDPTLSAPFSGAGVAGVQYFTTQNGNTVASNVVTEATGAAISSATLLGYQAEGARTNLVLQSQTAGTTWTATNVTVAADSIAAPNGTTTADTLTASAGNGTWLQGVTVASAAKTFSIWLKRKTGTGNIDLTLDNGSTWNTKTITSSWAKYEITQTLANPTVGVRIVTNADAVYVWGAQLEDAVSFSSSYIPTTTVSVTRNAEIDSYVSASNIAAAAGTVSLQYTPTHTPSGTIFLFGTYVDASNYTAILHDATNLIFRKRIAGANTDATIANSFVAGTTYKMAASWGAAGMSIVLNGTIGTPHANTTNAQIGTNFQVGADGNSLQQPFFAIKNFAAYTSQLTDAAMQTLTT